MRVIRNIAELEEALGFSLARYYPHRSTSHPGNYLSALTSNLANAAAKADPLAIQDACAIVELDPNLPFGKLIKSTLARALRKSAGYVQAADRKRIVRSTCHLLSLDYCPRELEDYCKLVRKLGGAEAGEVISAARPIAPKSLKLFAYLESAT